MSEKYVLAHTRRDAGADRWGGNNPESDSYKLMSVGEDFVSIADSDKVVGQNKNGKTYVRFETPIVTIFKLGEYADGRPKVNVYRKDKRTRPRGGWGNRNQEPRRASLQNITPTMLGSTLPFDQYFSIGVQEFFKLYERRFGPVDEFPTTNGLGRLAYPILKHNPEWTYAPTLGSALRMADSRSFVETAFGKTRYRKDLVKAVSNVRSLYAVALVRQFRGIIPVDWMVEALNEWPNFGLYDDYPFAEIRFIATAVDQNSARRLLRGLYNDEVPRRWITDAARSLRQIRDFEQKPELGKVSGWREVHDLLMVQARQAIKPNKPIPQKHRVVKALDGVTLQVKRDNATGHEEYTLRSAKDTDTLEIWGNKMSNCIGGYDRAALDQRSLLFGVYAGDTLVGNMEVSPQGLVRQLVGKHNAQFYNGGAAFKVEVEKLSKPELPNPNAVVNFPEPGRYWVEPNGRIVQNLVGDLGIQYRNMVRNPAPVPVWDPNNHLLDF